MKRMILPIGALLVVIAFILTVYISLKHQIAISNKLGLDVSRGKVMTSFDTHGGFHGDGTAYTVLSFSDNKVLEQIKASAKWNEFPLDELVNKFVYGVSDGTSIIRSGVFVKDEFGNPLVPEIQNGYYRLIDRQRDQSEDIMHRASFNFTLVLYDTDTNTLYYWELDT